MNKRKKRIVLASCAAVVILSLFGSRIMSRNNQSQLENTIIKNAKSITNAPMVEIIDDNNNKVLVHCYEVITDEAFTHTATYAWYEVNTLTGTAEDLLTSEVFNIFNITK